MAESYIYLPGDVRVGSGEKNSAHATANVTDEVPVQVRHVRGGETPFALTAALGCVAGRVWNTYTQS